MHRAQHRQQRLFCLSSRAAPRRALRRECIEQCVARDGRGGEKDRGIHAIYLHGPWRTSRLAVSASRETLTPLPRWNSRGIARSYPVVISRAVRSSTHYWEHVARENNSDKLMRYRSFRIQDSPSPSPSRNIYLSQSSEKRNTQSQHRARLIVRKDLIPEISKDIERSDRAVASFLSFLHALVHLLYMCYTLESGILE